VSPRIARRAPGEPVRHRVASGSCAHRPPRRPTIGSTRTRVARSWGC
jgi:hypothetical protein